MKIYINTEICFTEMPLPSFFFIFSSVFECNISSPWRRPCIWTQAIWVGHDSLNLVTNLTYPNCKQRPVTEQKKWISTGNERDWSSSKRVSILFFLFQDFLLLFVSLYLSFIELIDFSFEKFFCCSSFLYFYFL